MRAISLREFALRLGIYTLEEIEQGLLGRWHSATDQQLLNFWKQLVDNRDFNVMYIKDSRHRVLYQIISAALFGYQETLGNLDHTDIRIMHSLLTEQYLCPALYIAKACEERFPGEWNNPNICGGKIVTKLAESYGLLTTQFTHTLEPIGRVFILDIQQFTNLTEPQHTSWVLSHDASPNNLSTSEIPLEAIHTEPTELVSIQPDPNTVLESSPSHPDASSSRQGASSFHQGVPSPVPEILSFQELLELPTIPSYQTLLGLPEISSPQDFLEFPEIPSSQILLELTENPPSQYLLDFPEFPMPEIPPQLSLEEMLQEMNPQHTVYLGESSQQGVPSNPQNISPSTPVVQPTFEDLVREVQELKKNLADSTAEIKKDLADLTTWLKNRLP